MNKRSFLKATGVTFVASLLATPFLGRRESVANAQENEQIPEIKKLRGEFDRKLAEVKAMYQDELREQETQLIGSVVAITHDKSIPKGWHLCDGTPIDKKFVIAYKIIGERFPDLRGVFLRGLDEVATDGSDMDVRRRDPDHETRTIGSFQDSENLKHSHGADGKTEPDGTHNHKGRTEIENLDFGNPGTGGIGGVKIAKFVAEHWGDSRHRKHTTDDTDDIYCETEPDVCCVQWLKGPHSHGIKMEDPHSHAIALSGGDESRPKNVAVRYIVKYALLSEFED